MTNRSTSDSPPRLSPQARGVLLLRQRGELTDAATDLPHRGHVDALNRDAGLSGWVASEPWSGPLDVELWCDDVRLAESRASGPRADIWADRSPDRPTGFLFDLDTLLKCGARADIGPTTPLRVRVRGSDAWLPAARAWTFADLQVLRAPRSEAPYVEGRDGPLEPELQRLSKLGYRQISDPLPASARKHAGALEVAVRLTPRLLWVGGWKRRELPDICAMLITAPAFKRAAALCVVSGPRADLPHDAHAFAGILYVDDGLDVADLDEQSRLFFAGHSLDWLAPVANLRRPSLASALDEAEALLEGADTERRRHIMTLIRAAQPWDRRAQNSLGASAQLGIDRFLVAPGFGVFLSGWLLSAVNRPLNISARLGSAVFTLDASSLHLSRRDDLASVFPALADRTALAGFNCLLRGFDLPDHSAPWALRIEFDDGAVHLQDLGPENARRVDAEFDLAALNAMMPGLEWAPWLDDLVDALQGQSVALSSQGLHWIQNRSMPRALVCALPLASSHHRLALDALAHARHALAQASAGLLLVLPPTLSPNLWASWLTRWQDLAGTAPPVAAVRTGAGADPWHALPPALAACEVQRFAFIGPSALLTPAGATAATQHLCASSEAIHYFNLQALRGDEAVLSHSAQAFAWSTHALSEHLSSAPPLLPGWWRKQGLPAGGQAAPTPTDLVHGRLLAPPNVDPLKDSINRRLLVRPVRSPEQTL